MAERNSRAEPPRPIHAPPMPKRTLPQRRDTPDAIARAVVAGGIGAAEAARRVDALAALAADAKAALWIRHRVRMLIENTPPPGTFAAAVDAVDYAGQIVPLPAFAPQWIQNTRRRDGGRDRKRLYSRLYFLAFALGHGGREFEFAQGAVARAFGCDGGDVREFVRKAAGNGNLEIAWHGRIVSTYLDRDGRERKRYAANGYRFIPEGCEGGAGEAIYTILAEKTPGVVFGSVARGDMAATVAGI